MRNFNAILFLFFVSTSFSQFTFVRQNGTTNVYYQIGDVFTNALAGDTIYLPGGAFNISTLTIDKELHIFGAGVHPDSTTATYQTTLTGNITFITNAASNSSLTGVNVSGYVRTGNSPSSSDVQNLTITRCDIGTIELSSSSSYTSLASNIFIDGNVVRGSITGRDAQFVYIQNNLIAGAIQDFNGNLLARNNTFLGGIGCSSYFINDITSGTFENNIFMNNGNCSNNTINSNVSSSIFSNNVFNRSYTFPYNTNLGSGNYFDILLTGFFVDETDYSFSFTNDYHLNTPGSYLGLDATQCGMYGGFAPFKAGAVPVNPHISSKTIAPQTDVNGDLNINITVGAQDN